ncbi:DUF2163 domain-containing protein [Pontivivens insulae]|uniref:Bacteriophage phiJL001 Gp84 C-terminal domain-containing protein n=1 Tax=Pontivivens insulae TaxID=1639689 RepID=A0A2R8AAF2_9RHOB|nr:DUF2163 domain-containing protein [Pontivivens insulae]RED13089.1 putative phage protein (TIGR02218 family) [Pontivivens insulae]SPF29181.1 hypothetical protein POI8812_01488 [Pontivivens insulae]
MREISDELQARLDSGATTLCRCWILTRTDGVVMGFTDHDSDLRVRDVLCKASTGMIAGALDRTTGLASDNGQALGALSAGGITEADIADGRYDGATVQQYLVDWTRPELDLSLFAGRIGEIARADGAFEAELRSLADDLNTPAGRMISASCDAQVGDLRCGVDLDHPDYRLVTVVDAVTAQGVLVGGLDAYEPGWFDGGVLVWTDGPLAGQSVAIKRDGLTVDGQREVVLWSEPVAGIGAGTGLRLTAGCDRRAATCRTKFANFLNYRGFPHIPGEDFISSYPNRGEGHDGSSLQR